MLLWLLSLILSCSIHHSSSATRPTLTMSSGEYMIFHPERATVLDLLKFLFFDSNLSNYKHFVDTNVTAKPETSFIERLLIIGSFLFMNYVSSVAKTWDKFTCCLDYALNFLSLNGGLFGLIWRAITGSIVFPQPGNADYRSIKSFINAPIVDAKVDMLVKYVANDDPEMGSYNQPMVLLATMASNLAYENLECIKKIVATNWQMHFVEFFECYNLFLKVDATEAFIFCDRATDARWIFLAFRGTSQFHDWRSDLDLSWVDTKVMGKVHVGFMEALGLQNDKNFAAGFPKDYTGSKKSAYYSIRAKLRELVTKHRSAKIVVTGHSLGGALAVLFTSILSYHNEKDVLNKIEHVYTFGQPRVGDDTFGGYMNSVLGDKYRRMVYRFDIVPRVPFDLHIYMNYKHFGSCVQYEGWFKGKEVTDMKDVNYFNPICFLQIYWAYLQDFAVVIWWGITKGQWEGWFATLYRICCVILPGVVFHNTSNYINAATYANVVLSTSSWRNLEGSK